MNRFVSWGKLLIYFFLIILIGSLVGCRANPNAPVPTEENRSSLITLKVVADSEQAIEAFRMEEKAIREKFHIRFQYFYPDRLSDHLEDFLFASKDTYDLYILFPAKLPEYVEREMLLPLDSYTSDDPSIQEIIPIYRNLYMHYGGHDYGVVYDGDAHLLFYRKDLFEKYGAE
ncbi:extracellular solute-binding protein, partial [Thermicanus aegyptius]|uniref:extracellular solute-binding protein n=1 Tax=Thermicanus aegyptius TaxID=94009 RepID=UPI0005869F4A